MSKVLVIDDEQDIREIISYNLIKEGFQVETAEDGVKGIELVDDYTIRITLHKSYSAFKSLLAHNGCWIFPKEAYDKYGKDMRSKCVGTGPFKINAVDEGTQVRLVRNPNYWEKDENGNQLPYLDIVKITFTKDKPN